MQLQSQAFGIAWHSHEELCRSVGLCKHVTSWMRSHAARLAAVVAK